MTMDVSLVIGGLKGILENLCDNYSDSIIGQAASTSRDYLKNRNVDSKIKEVASCLTGLKCRDDTLFLSDLQAAFSKDNLQKILKEIRKDDQCINYLYPDLLKIADIEIIFYRFIEYWEIGRSRFDDNEHRDFYYDEFYDRYQALERVIGSFSFEIDQMNSDLVVSLLKMFDEMSEYGINTLESRALLFSKERIEAELGENIIDQFYSDDKNKIADATNAAEHIILKWPELDTAKELLIEQIRLIRYGKQPGLQMFYISIHNLAYMGVLDLSDEILMPLDKALLECAEHTAYEKIKECTEKEIKSTINLRSACARTAFQIDKCISEKPDAPVLKGIEKWKEICIGRLSNNEFVEVKRQWLL